MGGSVKPAEWVGLIKDRDSRKFARAAADEARESLIEAVLNWATGTGIQGVGIHAMPALSDKEKANLAVVIHNVRKEQKWPPEQ